MKKILAGVFSCWHARFFSQQFSFNPHQYAAINTMKPQSGMVSIVRLLSSMRSHSNQLWCATSLIMIVF
jgi:hypothetical protein